MKYNPSFLVTKLKQYSYKVVGLQILSKNDQCSCHYTNFWYKYGMYEQNDF